MITKDKISDVFHTIILIGTYILLRFWLVICGYLVFVSMFSTELYIGFLNVSFSRNISMLLYGGIAILSLFVFNYYFELEDEDGCFYGIAAIPFVLFVILRGTRIPLWIFIVYALFLLFGFCTVKEEIRKKRRSFRLRNKRLRKTDKISIIKKNIGRSVLRSTNFAFVILYGSMIITSLGFRIPDRLNVLNSYRTVNSYEGDSEILRGETYDYKYDSGNSLWIEHYDELKTLSFESYPKATLQERLKSLQVLSDIEAAYLGCDNPPVIISNNKKQANSGTIGYYNRGENTIWIKEDRVMDNNSRYAISTLLHEIRHVYQHRCCELIDIDSIPEKQRSLKMYTDIIRWKYEIENYEGSEDRFDDYSNQYMEQDSRNYSDMWIDFYYGLVNSTDASTYFKE